MLEFTGERVVPGLVNANLLNEHLARYRFARRFVAGGACVPVRVLDAGCGAGYGSAQFGPQAFVVGIDLAADALRYASEQYARPGLEFLQAGCEDLPFADGSFDLVVAFEVIEHLERWRDLLREARRVLKPEGLLLVSTPNKSYYAESRGKAGPNPWHVHEFEYGEFAAALGEVFPQVRLMSQNHAEGIAIIPSAAASGVLDAPGDPDMGNANFFFAVCGAGAIPPAESFAYVESGSNVLQARERHVALLEDEVAKKTEWLESEIRAHATLKAEHDAVLSELEQRNAWAANLDEELATARRIIARLEDEIQAGNRRAAEATARLEAELADAHRAYREKIGTLEDEVADTRRVLESRMASETARLESEIGAAHQVYGEQIARLEEESEKRLAWVRDLERQIANGEEEISRRVAELTVERKAYAERSRWGEEKAEEARRAAEIINWQKERMAEFRGLKWVEWGRRLGQVPEKFFE